MTLSVIAASTDPVSTALLNNTASKFGQSIVPTHTFENAPDLDVLIIPGGHGTREELGPLLDWLRKVYPSLKYIFTICTGSWLTARAGILDGKRATSNKAAFAEAAKTWTNVKWVKQARWVVDGNIWTTSGVSAGIDGMLALIGETYGEETAEKITNVMEYERHRDPSWDPFAEIYPD
jgi:transcriptional regulator GlxA family with amidase domain